MAQRQARAVRLVFTYDDDGLHLAGAVPRRKPAPRSDDTVGEPPANAVSVTVRLRDGSVVYRRLMSEPIPQSVEVIEAGTIRRLPWAPSRGALAVVVPALDQPAEVVVDVGNDVDLRQPVLREGRTRADGRRELGRFDLPRVR